MLKKKPRHAPNTSRVSTGTLWTLVDALGVPNPASKVPNARKIVAPDPSPWFWPKTIFEVPSANFVRLTRPLIGPSHRFANLSTYKYYEGKKITFKGFFWIFLSTNINQLILLKNTSTRFKFITFLILFPFIVKLHFSIIKSI